MRTVFFKGQSGIDVTDELKNRLYDQLERLIQGGAEDFYSGGSRGWDMLCGETVLNLRAKYPRVKLHIVLPCSEAAFAADWSDDDRERNRRILSAADSREVCGGSGSGARFPADNADCCVCFFGEGSLQGYEEQTLLTARERGAEIINLRL